MQFEQKIYLSQEIGDYVTIMRTALTFFIFGESSILAFCGIGVDSQKTTQITTAVAVVRSRPHGHDIFVIEQLLVPLVHQLMRPRN